MRQYVKPFLAEIEIDPETLMRRSQFIPVDSGGGGPFDVKTKMEWGEEKEKHDDFSQPVGHRDLWNDVW